MEWLSGVSLGMSIPRLPLRIHPVTARPQDFGQELANTPPQVL